MVLCDQILLKCIKYEIIIDILHLFTNLYKVSNRHVMLVLTSSFKRRCICVLHFDVCSVVGHKVLGGPL
jgi:hypothetical protein